MQGSEIRCPPHSGYHCRLLHTLLDSVRSVTLFLSQSISFFSRHDQFISQVTPRAEPKTERKQGISIVLPSCCRNNCALSDHKLALTFISCSHSLTIAFKTTILWVREFAKESQLSRMFDVPQVSEFGRLGIM